MQPEGDHGNAVALTARARQYGLAVTSAVVHPGDHVPAADWYLLGGSEDADLAECARRLRSEAGLEKAAERGAVILGVGAGYSVLARSFQDSLGNFHPGAGLLDAEVDWAEPASGPVVTRPDAELGLPALSGYEFHCGRARLGPTAEPMFTLELGIGDRSSSEGVFDGCRAGSVIGTWLHGPLLPRNPELTDLLLRWARPDLPPQSSVEALDDELAELVRRGRIAEARSARDAST
jgi:CobQ-like glutamine amidotransferase family enzyme